MVYRAKSSNVKCLRARKKHDAIMQKAVDAYRKGKQEAKTQMGLRAIASKHGVNYVTLSRQAKGGRSISEFNASKQKISKVEENVLVQFIKESADRGFPMSHQAIAFHADAILQSRLGDGYEPVGESWIFRFLDRHEDELQTHWSKPLNMQRARALNPEVVDTWFDLVERWVVNQGIKKEDIYGMDESGFPPSGQGTERVVGGRGVKTQHKQGGADWENVTALVTICADGTALRPTIIFKGKNFMKKWGKDNIANAS